MKQWIVYKHTSMRSGKSYIGVTFKSMEIRWSEHCRLAGKTGYHFHNAIQLYGTDNWQHIVLADEIDTIEEAYALEKYYIKHYDTFENGYNSTLGGEGYTGVNYFDTLTEDEYISVCKARSDRNTDHTKYTFYNPALNMKETLSVRDMAEKYKLHKGYIRYVAKKKSSHCNGWFLWEGPDKLYEKSPVYSIEHSDYGIVTETIKALASAYNLSKGNLCMVVKGQRDYTKGWTLVGNQKVLSKEKVPGNALPVIKICVVTGTVAAEYPSIQHAARENKLSENIVGERCRGSCKTNNINGYRYEYKQDKVG